jgi:hypothetical protein
MVKCKQTLRVVNQRLIFPTLPGKIAKLPEGFVNFRHGITLHAAPQKG